jgi:rare lipoprotein A
MGGRSTMKMIIVYLIFVFTNYKEGKVSYYSSKFEGRKTASGITFSNNKMYAAHKTLKFGTKVRIFNNLDTIIVVVVDRGKLYDRTFDLSQKAFSKLSPLKKGIINVKYEILHD